MIHVKKILVCLIIFCIIGIFVLIYSPNGFKNIKLYERCNTLKGDWDIGYWIFDEDEWMAQTFTVGSSGDYEDHIVTSVRLLLRRDEESLPKVINISIWDTNIKGFPSGTPLTIGIINGNIITTSQNGQWYKIKFENEIRLRKEETYAIVAKTNGGDHIEWLTFDNFYGEESPYIGGYFFTKNGFGWEYGYVFKPDAIDCVFEEYGYEEFLA